MKTKNIDTDEKGIISNDTVISNDLPLAESSPVTEADAYFYLNELLQSAKQIKSDLELFADRYQAVNPELIKQLHPSKERWENVRQCMKKCVAAHGQFETQYKAANGKDRHSIVEAFLEANYWDFMAVDVNG